MKTGRASLVWRLYGVGVVQLALVLLAAVGIGWAVSHSAPPWEAQAASAQLAPLVEQPKALQRALDQLHARNVLVSLYDSDRKLIATNARPPLPLPPWGPMAGPGAPNQTGKGTRPATIWPPPKPRPAERPHPGTPAGPPAGPPPFMDVFDRRGPPGAPPPPLAYAHLALPRGDGLLVARVRPPRPSAIPIVLTLLSGLAVIFVGAFLTARWIARPIRRLSLSASALGAGDFSVRTGIDRSDELGDLACAFDDMAVRLARSVEAERELLANVAHELRTPLARIRVALEIASEGDANTARASLAEIATDLSELEQLITDVMTATRLGLTPDMDRSAGFALHPQVISTRALVTKAADRFRHLHPTRTLELQLPSELPDVKVDPMLMRRVLGNLLENAHKYSPNPEAPIVLTASVNPVDPTRVHLSVEDRGMGIAPDDLPNVFSPFFRAERSRFRGTGGVGLGLTLAKSITEAHGGTLRLESAVGKGTTAHLSLGTNRAT